MRLRISGTLPALLIYAFLAAVSCQGGTPKQEAEKKEIRADKLIVYYFHTTFRCWTCNQFENLTKAVVAERFADQTKQGLLEIRILNVDNPENRHYIKGYKLYTKSVVLSLTAGGAEMAWENLDQIWQLVRDEQKFREYVGSHITKKLKQVAE
jgi:hypothetical protein